MKIKKLLSLYLFCIITGTSAIAQTLFWQDNFEDATGPLTGGGTRTPSVSFSSGGPPATRYFFRTMTSGISTTSSISGVEGSYVWAGEDIDNTNTQTAHQNVTWTGINISGKTGISFRGLFGTGGATGAFDNTAVSGNGTDYIIVEYRIDGGSWTSAIRFMPISTVASTLLGLETTNDSIGDGTTLSNALAEFTYNISGTGTTMDIRAKFFANSLVEEVLVDNFRLYSSPACSMTASITSQTNVSCNGGTNGSLTVTQSSGTANFTYSWSTGTSTTNSSSSSNTLSTLSAATYTCTITDANGCTATKTATITQPSALSVTQASQANISCNGGSNGTASINTPTGGAGGYTYTWTPGNPAGNGTVTVSALSLGTWVCTITDANSCTASTSFNITQPTMISVTQASQTNVNCNGSSTGAASINTPSGGAGGYTYDWTPGSPSGDGSTSISNLAAGTFTCTITDANNCTRTSFFTITQPTALSASTSMNLNVACNGAATGSTTASASGGAGGYSYSWNNNKTTTTISNLAAATYTCTVTDANGCTKTATTAITEPSALVASASVNQNVNCFGGNNGKLDGSASGGASNYSYSWNNGQLTSGATGLQAGTYTLTITDANSCTKTKTASITQPNSALTASVSIVANNNCYGAASGQLSASVSGGTTNYNYSWNNNQMTAAATGLQAGTFTCTVTDANNCTTTASGTITEPGLLTATASANNHVSCRFGSNGTATASGSGGTTNYTYSWNNTQTNSSATGLSAGIYTVIIYDANACTATTTVTITQPADAVTPSGISAIDVLCFGESTGSITMTPPMGGTGNFTYDWAPGTPSGDGNTAISNLAAGTYTCTMTDANGCSATKSATVTEPFAALTASVSSQTDVLCNGESNGTATVTASGGTLMYSYSWNAAGGTNAIGTGLSAGIYTCTVTDNHGCTTSTTVTISQPLTLVVFTTADIHVTCPGGTNGQATLATNGGVMSYTYVWNNSSTTSTITNLGAGTYTCIVYDGNNCTATASVVITEPNPFNVITGSSDISCYGANDGWASVDVSGSTAPYTYSWDNSATTDTIKNLNQNWYMCTITDANNCTTSASVSITEPAPIAVIFSVGAANDTMCNILSAINLSGTPSGGTFAGTGVSNNMFDPATANPGWNVITYTYTDNGGCSGMAMDSIFVDICTGANAQFKVSSSMFQVYPNPNNGTFTVSIGELKQEATLQIINTLGEVVYAQQITNLPGRQAGNQQLITENLPTGIYTLTLTVNNTIQKQKLVIQ